MIGAIESQVKLRFHVDTTQAKQQLKGLEKEQRKLHQSVIDQAEAQNKKLDDQIAKWTKVAVGVGAAVGAYKILEHASERYAKVAQLEGAAAGANIERIQRAARGLITEYDALSFAAASLNTDFKLSQRQMEDVAKFMVVLRNQGNNLAEVQKEVTKSIVEGNAEGLKKFGVVIQGVKPGLEAHHAIMQRIAEENAKAGTNLLRAGDEAAQAKVRWKDSLDSLVLSLGKIAEAIAPIVGALGGLVGVIAQVAEGVIGLSGSDVERVEFVDRMRLGGMYSLVGRGDVWQARVDAARSARTQRGIDAALSGADEQARIFDARIAGQDAWRSILDPHQAHLRRQYYQRAQAGGGPAAPYSITGTVAPGQVAQPWSLTGGNLPASVFDRGMPVGSDLGTGMRFFGGQDMAAGFQAGLGGQTAKTFDSVVKGSQVATQALAGFQTAGSAAFAALITGSESFATAFRKAMASSILGQATDLAGKALYHGVYAIGSLAFGDIRGASQHGIAAAKSAAGAAALGALARGLGAGQGGGGGALPAAAAGAVGGGGASGGGGGSNVTVFVGSDFEGNSRANASRLSRAFDRARRAKGDDPVVFE